MMTPAQYWISGGSVGGGFGRSYSCELGLNVNRSTKENTFVWRVVVVVGVTAETGNTAATELAFSFPLRLAKALKKPELPREDGPAARTDCCEEGVACGLSVAVAGWKLVLGW
jgi:hypothetical protein